MERRKDIKWFGKYYEISTKWRIRAKERRIEKASRRWGMASFMKKQMILTPEIKISKSWYKQLRVKIKNEDTRKTFYVARCVYVTFNNIDYSSSRHIHFRDWNSFNCNLENLYRTGE